MDFISLRKIDKLRELKYLKQWCFKNGEEYIKFIEESTRDLEFTANRIFEIFQRKIEELGSKISFKEGNRVVAEVISPPENKLIKSPERIAFKIFESWDDFSIWENKEKNEQKKAGSSIRHDPRSFLLTMDDIIRFRIICNYLDDIKYIAINMEKKISSIKKEILTIDKRFKELIYNKVDYLDIPYPDRRKGHRGMKYNFKILSKNTPILFEVQIMSQLQHAWDKKDHHLIYEHERAGHFGIIPLYLKNKMAAMSELLYVADTVFDELKTKIINIFKRT